MDQPKRFEYHRVAKQMGVPNIILTGIEKKAKIEFPDDDRMYACHVLKILKALAQEYAGQWMNCDVVKDKIPPAGRKIFKR